MKNPVIVLRIILKKISVLMLSCLFLTSALFPAEPDSLFRSDEILNMVLKADFSALQNDRDKIPAYHNGILIYHAPGGDTISLSVKVMVRGNFRRDPANCNFPPLFVNFRKKEVENTLFDNQDKLKLVTPCHAEEDIIEEYTIYKLYNQVTDLSMKVRLVRMLYFDNRLDKEVFTRFSFFIEHEDQVAERNDAFVKDRFITPFDLNTDNARKLSVFQYIIGNKDWQFTSRHNLVIIQPNDTSLAPYAVPFDFDFSGFVNAHYTKPRGVPEDLLPTRRLYNGICYSEAEFKDVFEYYIKLKPVFESIITNTTFLAKYRRQEKIRYLNDSYSVFKNRQLFKDEFLGVCRTKKDYGISE